MRIGILILSVVNLVYLITTFAANDLTNIYLSPFGLPHYIAIALALLSVLILIITKSGEGRDKKLLLTSMIINIVGIFLIRIFF